MYSSRLSLLPPSSPWGILSLLFSLQLNIKLKVDDRARQEVLASGVEGWLSPLLRLAAMSVTRWKGGEEKGGEEWEVRVCLRMDIYV